MPPLLLFWIAALGVLLRRKRKWLGNTLVLGAMAVLIALCMPWVSASLLTSLQTEPVLSREHLDPQVGAIVVLGGDVSSYAPEFGAATVGPLTLERLRYAAELARLTALPLLASGGATQPDASSLAAMMKLSLEHDFHVEVRWTEDLSLDTRENAIRSAEILAAAGIERIYLVTHAWHMPRARAAFEAAGVEVVPAPTAFRAPPALRPMSFVPSARSLRESQWAVHEWIGRAWYAIRD